MGLLGSLFGASKMNRNEYNAKVSETIYRDYGITPDSKVDSRFPGTLAYLELIDEAYYHNAKPEQAALKIMVMLLSGLKKSELSKDNSDAIILFDRVRSSMRKYLSDGTIPKGMYDQYSEVIKKHTGYIV